MFKRVGSKIKAVAKVFFWVDVVAFLIYLAYEADSIGLGLETVYWVVLGIFLSWVAAICIYGFGIIVERHEEAAWIQLNRLTREIFDSLKSNFEYSNVKEPVVIAKNECNNSDVALDKNKENANGELVKQLSYALEFRTDEGMICYLRRVSDERVSKILHMPNFAVREQIAELLKSLMS